ncbi:fumarylacetoacetate hydrolase family protein [Geomicrobium sp. JCM 19038]|uniref:fumarylacetoacetate hydrolase family protein n=1 Tax=Geomicrobium sp. JCM 19038 TaxID=1460635 RepID=UPI00045F449B|nr:fumarylacetoacetate hydrolase family protein [Geomicrobium sp. JCM 19038]GAK09030.1 5-carboxymethyl-2-oxo-hex-3- ene-1,7-dioate decarboxylase [Geomicrobium sp. JCM 19038]
MVKIYSRRQEMEQALEAELDLVAQTVTFQSNTYDVNELRFAVPKIGTVYGTALNYEGELANLGEKVNEAPYKNPPKAPVLYIKPRNTFCAHKADIPFPEDSDYLQAGAALGIVLKKQATRVPIDHAADYIAGFTIVNDVSIPHESMHRPAIKQKARDGFCPIGPWVVDASDVDRADDLNIHVYINDERRQSNSTKNLIRDIHTLLADVTDYMTLYEGDVLLVGTPENPPLFQAGDTVRIDIEGIGSLENKAVAKSTKGVNV